MRIDRDNTIVMMIDLQDRLIKALDGKEELMVNCKKLIKGLRALDIPIIVTEQYRKGLGSTNEELMELSGANRAYDKLTFSCYKNEEIKRAIDNTHKKNIIVFGAEAHICVLSTLIDLNEAGYNTVLVSDCIASRKPSDKAAAIDRAKSEGSVITTYESILFELLVTAEDSSFKEISSIIK